MAKISLAKLDLAALLKFRDDVGVALRQKARELEGQLERLGGEVVGMGRGGRRGSPLRGQKVAPKYGTQNWRHVGRPWCKTRWLVARIKEGKKALGLSNWDRKESSQAGQETP